MDITTQYNLSDIVYSQADAEQGNLIPLIIEKINITVESTDITTITYQVSNTNYFHNTEMNESDLIEYNVAKEIVERKMQDEIVELQGRINQL